MKKTFYSNGKLLITGEYLVLDGAKAFALPTKSGQNLIVENGVNHEINWKSYNADGRIWLEERIPFKVISSGVKPENESILNTLITILQHAYLLNPNFLHLSEGYCITTELTFPKNWGLGTSSTLINNIAQWLEIDAFVLLKNSFGGSGYDVACAQNNWPILYHLKEGKPLVEKTTFNPLFIKNLYFVYLNKKQNSKTAIASYNKNNRSDLAFKIEALDKITFDVLNAKTIQQFAYALEQHEQTMSAILGIRTVKEDLFPDYDGVVKSLGAWGGDFVMIISEKDPTEYFQKKGYNTLLKYNEMILTT
jgi:mevalonate kinase